MLQHKAFKQQQQRQRHGRSKKNENKNKNKTSAERPEHIHAWKQHLVWVHAVFHIRVICCIHTDTAQTKCKGAAYFIECRQIPEWKLAKEGKGEREAKRKKMPIHLWNSYVYACACKLCNVRAICKAYQWKKCCAMHQMHFMWTHKVDIRYEYGQFDAEWISRIQNKCQSKKKRKKNSEIEIKGALFLRTHTHRHSH